MLGEHTEPAVASGDLALAPDVQGSRRFWHGLTLRSKTLLIVSLALFGLMILLLVPMRLYIVDSLGRLEEHELSTNAARARSALLQNIQALDQFNISYASSDDTYAFAVNRDPTYIEKNLYDDYLIRSRISFIIIFDADGQQIFGKALDPAKLQPRKLPARLRQLVAGDPLLRPRGVAGILQFPDGPALVSAQPILTSHGTGQARGTLVSGRYLDDSLVRELSEITQLPLRFKRVDEPDQAAELGLLRKDLERGAPVAQALSDELIAGYALITDLDGSPGLVARIEEPRVIYQRGWNGLSYLTVGLLLSGLVFGLLTIVLLERVVLSRLAQLSTSLQLIGKQRSLAARVEMTGDDELMQFAGTINRMLEDLEQAQLARALAEAQWKEMLLEQEAITAKREFVAMVSHELRTPLTPIIGFVDLLLRHGDNLDDEQRQFLDRIKANGARMLLLIEDLLEMGRLEAENVVLHWGQVSLASAIADAVQLLQPEIERKQMDVRLEIAPDLRLIEGDARRLGQVLVNLISNAVKYTYPGGRIVVRARCDDEQAEMQIEDNGVGISAEQQAKLFTPFYRAESVLREQTGGTGLGLSIVKALVELHGGEVWIRSVPGQGSTFGFRVPLVRR